MFNANYARLSLLALALALAASAATAQTDIRPAPGGERLLFVDKDGSISKEPGGKTLLYVDGQDIRDQFGGRRLLFVDGDDVRPEPGGIRLAFLDADGSIRRTPGSKRLLFIDGDDIRDEPGGKRLYFIDGPALNHPQLTAVLSLLRPDLFKLTAAEEEALKKSMKEAAAESDRHAGADHVPGKYTIASFSSSDDTNRRGDCTVTPVADWYALEFTFRGVEEPWTGMAVKHKNPASGDTELWTAFGPKGTTALAVYEIEKGKLKGTWYRADVGADKAKLGTEVLTGPAELGGKYTVAEAKTPVTGTPYFAEVTITPIPDKTMDGNVVPCTIEWNFGGVVLKGIGIRVGNHLIAGSGSKPEFAVAHFATANGLVGDFFASNSSKGFYTMLKAAE